MKGKIVVCRDVGGAVYEALVAGSLGSVIYNVALLNYSTIEAIPVSRLSIEDFSVVEAYLNSTMYVYLLCH